MDSAGTFQIEIPQLTALQNAMASFSSIAQPIIQAAIVASSAVLAKYTTREDVPWLTGNLTQSFRLQTGTLFARWFPTASYANYVYFGTGVWGPEAREILPKKGNFLVWDGPNGKVFARSSKGMKPNYYIDRIANKSMAEISAQFQTAIEKITEAVANEAE